MRVNSLYACESFRGVPGDLGNLMVSKIYERELREDTLRWPILVPTGSQNGRYLHWVLWGSQGRARPRNFLSYEWHRGGLSLGSQEAYGSVHLDWALAHLEREMKGLRGGGGRSMPPQMCVANALLSYAHEMQRAEVGQRGAAYLSRSMRKGDVQEAPPPPTTPGWVAWRAAVQVVLLSAMHTRVARMETEERREWRRELRALRRLGYAQGRGAGQDVDNSV